MKQKDGFEHEVEDGFDDGGYFNAEGREKTTRGGEKNKGREKTPVHWRPCALAYIGSVHVQYNCRCEGHP